MENISGFGTRLTIRASVTFPVGFTVTEFADDADAIDSPSIQIADKASGLNGDLLVWSRANPINVTVNVIPGSEAERNLAILLEANRPGRGKTPALDQVTLTMTLPDGSGTIYNKGAITDGPPSRGPASTGRLKTMAYQFTFENKVEF
jgi:hypothetical protein